MSSYLSVISDPHGCLHTFKALLEKLPKENNQIVIVGDIIDRGPSSYQLYEFIKEQGLELIIGNHEYMFLHRNQSKEMMDLWLSNGGDQTLNSIKNVVGNDDQTAMDNAINEMDDYFKTLKLKVKVKISDNGKNPKFVLVSHAGVSNYFYELTEENLEECFNVDLWDDHSCLWNRDTLASIKDHIQIVGHSPVNFGPKKEGDNYYIDTGCVFISISGCGLLTALVYEIGKEEDPKIIQEQNKEDIS